MACDCGDISLVRRARTDLSGAVGVLLDSELQGDLTCVTVFLGFCTRELGLAPEDSFGCAPMR